MKKLFHLLQFFLVILVTFPLSVMPIGIALRIGNFAGTLAYYLWKSRREIAIENIKKSIEKNCLPQSPHAEDIAKASFGHLGRSFVELVKLYFNRGQSIIESVSITGIDGFHKAAAYNKGVIIVTGHYGNWELLALCIAQKISKVAVVARKQNNIYLNRIIEKVREKYGNSIIYKKGALRNLLSELSKGDTVGILYDQSVLEKEGIPVDFLGRKAWTMKTPVVISQKTGTPLLPVFIKKTSEGHRIIMYPPFLPDRDVDPEIHLQKLNGYLERHIKDDPTQWLWIHRRWKRMG